MQNNTYKIMLGAMASGLAVSAYYYMMKQKDADAPETTEDKLNCTLPLDHEKTKDEPSFL